MTQDIDFLPESFREAGAHRRYVTLRAAVVGVCLGIIACAGLYQQHLRRQAQRQLVELTPDHELATAARKHLADLQARLETAQRQAELAAFLEHPWPRSRILVSLADILPASIELESVKIVREQLPRNPDSSRVRAPAKGSEQDEKQVEPAEHDLTALRDEWDNSRLVVILTGLTDDPAALHRYLDELGKLPLFAIVDLSSVERITSEEAVRTRFSARVTVRPGYGQADGPAITMNTDR